MAPGCPVKGGVGKAGLRMLGWGGGGGGCSLPCCVWTFRAVSTPLGRILKTNKQNKKPRHKKLVTHAESYANAVSPFESGK